jgi:hypothetical protein
MELRDKLAVRFLRIRYDGASDQESWDTADDHQKGNACREADEFLKENPTIAAALALYEKIPEGKYCERGKRAKINCPYQAMNSMENAICPLSRDNIWKEQPELDFDRKGTVKVDECPRPYTPSKGKA